ncbi:hypothetical protein AMATHDRAFT_11543 [Amanita thiersii Skay4041]|uniref:Retrotransposon gag domain-containing protein n=1 Tax=Amanita thiersii Skay4041 TaxID=703135 RepID=A0A2A9N8W6_9AGAR|nr:hypothetical protein AMATHDRAFT_11543 [Amanita thiersii Skay4041]
MVTLPFYNGSMATCEAFINACQIYMVAKPAEFHDITTKVMWVLSYMQTGMAQQFCDHFLTTTKSDPIKILYKNIYQAFGDPNKQATTILELTTMKQGTKTAEEHVQVFKQAYSMEDQDTKRLWVSMN